jgi:hypothetical protein
MLEDMFAADNANLMYLRKQGLTESEIMMLTVMKKHIEEHPEYRERAEEQQRLNFARWLVEQGRIGK